MRNQDLQLSYWLVSSRPFFRRLVVVVLALLDLTLVVGLGLLWLGYARGASAYEKMIASTAENLVLYDDVLAQHRPPVLATSATTVLSESDGTYDLVAVARNPSEDWAIESVAYALLLEDQEVASGTATFFPNEEQFLARYDVHLSGVSPSARLEVEFSDYYYRRVFSEKDLRIPKLSIRNAAYRILNSTSGNQLSQVTAELYNEDVLDLQQVTITVLLYNGPSIVGVGQLILDRVVGRETRQIDLRFLKAFSVTSVQIRPTVDLFPPS